MHSDLLPCDLRGGTLIWNMYDEYLGPLKTSSSTLKSILKEIGSQFRDFSTGVICSLLLVFVRTLAAAFCIC